MPRGQWTSCLYSMGDFSQIFKFQPPYRHLSSHVTYSKIAFLTHFPPSLPSQHCVISSFQSDIVSLFARLFLFARLSLASLPPAALPKQHKLPGSSQRWCSEKTHAERDITITWCSETVSNSRYRKAVRISLLFYNLNEI